VSLAAAADDVGVLSDEARSELASGGLLDGEQLHPRLVSVARAIAQPSIRLHLEHTSSGSSCEGWFTESLAVLITRDRVDDPVGTVSGLPRGLVPAALARIVRLGPRRRPKVTDPIEIDAGLVEALLSSGGAFTASQIEGLIDPSEELVAAWLEVLARMSEEVRARWRLGVWWNSPSERPTARLIEVVDTDGGPFLLTRRPRSSRGARRYELRPATSTQLWRLLCALLPLAEEVPEPLSS
jgi:hypothetical protein